MINKQTLSRQIFNNIKCSWHGHVSPTGEPCHAPIFIVDDYFCTVNLMGFRCMECGTVVYKRRCVGRSKNAEESRNIGGLEDE